MDPHESVRALADDIYDALMAASPVEATLLGDRRFDARLPDVSPEGLAALRRELGRLTERLSRIDAATLPSEERVTADVAAHVLAQARHEVDAGYEQFAAGPMTAGSTIGGAASMLLNHLPKIVIDSQDAAAAYVERCRAVPAYLRAAEQQLKRGLDAGRPPVARLVAATARQIARYLALDGDDPLVPTPAPDAGVPERWRTDVRRVVADEVRPALQRHHTVLTTEIAPAARPDDRPGLCWLPGGTELYAAAARIHTTTSSTPEELHELGLDLIDELAAEYRAVGASALGTSDIAEIFARLRDDPALRFTSAAEIRRSAEVALARAQEAVGAWFGTLPSIPCEVRQIPAVEAPESTIAYYQPPALDGSRPGQYFVNTSDPAGKLRCDAEALAFHESVPGHHTQIARALELDLPVLQRVFYVTAFVEGWALYTERLADEMGLYSDELSRLGMLSFDSWRACRLVVDTGMHAFGWSRARAVEYMRANSPQAFANIDNEVDRYIGWPGQALAYMTGRSRIVELRRRAEQALGPRFDIRAFHDVVLGHAAVPLWTLERLVDEWIARQRHTAD